MQNQITKLLLFALSSAAKSTLREVGAATFNCTQSMELKKQSYES